MNAPTLRLGRITSSLSIGLFAAVLGACESKTESTASAEPSAKGAASRPAAEPADEPEAKEPGSDPKSSDDGRLTVGRKAPLTEREMPSVDGSMASVKSAAREKGVLVIFTCNHCPWVKAWQERTVATANEFLDKGVGVIAINSNDPSAYEEDGMDGMKARAEARGMKYPYVVDEGSEMARAYGASKTPEFFLFDADFQLVYHGTIDDNAQKPDQVKKTYLKDALTSLVNGEPITISETKALGCGIKFYDAS